ncbi:hypothetical protein PLICRDRAFT_110740 [Plicaturopsis crispa FD-325 SS-3]|nr:hypothetical protein PLICRDRAFT_110740 [Plicaturopsis crispa FD-325 SS-3]
MHVSAPRNASTPLSFSARSSLDPSSYAPIDSILKNLKTCSRRLQTALSAHRDEMQILERLHYKGKNQHRSALFWRRVTEIRRYGMRLHGVGLYGILETLRASFFGVSSAQNQKALKGSWTHVPNSRYVEFAIERLHACTSLVSKVRLVFF